MESDLISCAIYLQNAFKVCPGDVPKLRDYIIADFRAGKFSAEVFRKVLEDNIAACVQAGYANKEKVLQFLKSSLEAEEKKQIPDAAQSDVRSDTENAFTPYHAPKFVDDELCNAANREVTDVPAPDSFLDISNASALLLSTAVKNSKKKSEKKEVKKKAGSMADKVAEHLIQHGWAVCDNFIPMELVRRIRIEAGLLIEHFEQSEVWIGKHADVGAHVSVPSVRGDRVLWMCGGHNHVMAPDGVTRQVQTHGEIEPCKPQIKAQAPIRKFNGLRELMTACDKLMTELKPRVPRLAGVYERSDAMLAVYPGGGSRFAKHIDNTTRDGRVLTMLIYLNPGWTPAHGGALRISTASTGADSAQTAPDVPQTADDAAGVPAPVAAEAAGAAGGGSRDPGDAGAVDVYPTAGRLAMFLSSEVPHEVLPTFGDRHAVTFWWYDAEERRAALAESLAAGRAAEASATSARAQREAKAFMAALAGGDEVGADGIAADGSGGGAAALAALAARARGLSEEAAGVVASITGAPSGEAFKAGFAQLLPDDLAAMRALFRRMGLS